MKNGLQAAGELWLARASHVLQHHPRQVTAAIAALMLGAGGMAVASLPPIEQQLPPQRTVVEEVQAHSPAAQSEALDAWRFNLHRTELTRASDTVESLLGRLGINDPAAAAHLRNDTTFRGKILGRGGFAITAEATDTHTLVKLVARWAVDDKTFQRLVVERNAQGALTTQLHTGNLTPATRLASGTIYSSLFAATDASNVPDPITFQMVEIFGGQLDFTRSLRRGDRFSVVYETLEGDGEPLRSGRILSTEFINAGKSLQAVWFEQPGQRGAYYDFEGRSHERTFLASPMEVSRVTSGFAMRFHPILQQWRAHNGVDYGAPTGTPVRTVADGIVEFAGVQNGYGNVVVIDHGKGSSTLYAHLSRIDVRKGERVNRGAHIGAVGATGWATGPHLHFEFKQNGVHRDPLEIARQSQGAELSAEARPAFQKLSQIMRTQLTAAASQLASAQ